MKTFITIIRNVCMFVLGWQMCGDDLRNLIWAVPLVLSLMLACYYEGLIDGEASTTTR